ncbi:DEAD/DEAH box helicase family protein [Halocella sp. SP3-1]|uniref:DEAD/DEAH box helicase family protein n=1 Tax=Halocella sp. SP3-1 TaxID=2382161 RepID=UPI000F74E39D|nr:DEAD/DEAH box helicase family protein [Halocella sp. SP3-1]AZO94057.1 flagellar biosynthesis protein FlhF [Halocella sp. SP3-1]
MKVKKYVAETMQDAIFKVKADLGPEAIILDTNKFKKGGFLGFFTKTMVEIIAGVEEKKREFKQNNNNFALQEINDLKNMVTEIHKSWQNDEFLSHLSEELLEIYQHLNQQEVNEELAKGFIKVIKENKIVPGEINSQLDAVLQEYIGECQLISTDDSQKVIGFVGPTGVGKTTTIAKLAAHFTLDEGKKVCLITTDTYRIAAVQQLQTYSDIINIPLHVAYNEQELVKLIRFDLKDKYDLILIDTAGSSWKDGIQLGKLKTLLKRELVDEIHLMISLNTRSNIIREVIKGFSLLKPDKLILTKLDETSVYGDIINIKNISKLPYSYITIGQDVPDDLEAARAELLTGYLTGGLNV